jgi:DNA-binding NarL/FixJ family response regulator
MSTTPQRSQKSILIADDDGRVRRALRALIEADPRFEVVGEVSSVREVEECIHAPLPTIILVDMLFPTASEGLRLVRMLSRCRGCAVVAISAQDSLRTAALRAGALAFLNKGESPDAILGALYAVSH